MLSVAVIVTSMAVVEFPASGVKAIFGATETHSSSAVERFLCPITFCDTGFGGGLSACISVFIRGVAPAFVRDQGGRFFRKWRTPKSIFAQNCPMSNHQHSVIFDTNSACTYPNSVSVKLLGIYLNFGLWHLV